MYTLFITVRSIEAAARITSSINEKNLTLLQHRAESIVDDDYSVPSLIWPPPSSKAIFKYSYLATPPQYPPLHPYSKTLIRDGGTRWLSH